MKPINASDFVPFTPEDLKLGNSDTPVLPAPADTTYFSRCREGIYVAAAHCPTPGRKVMVPAYTCWTVFDPFEELGWEVAFYPVDRNLRIKKEEFLSILREFQPNVVVAQVSYGMDLNEEELGLLAEAKKAGCFILEDLTQAVFSDRTPDVIDAYTGSLYKWLPIPDGGFLRSKVLPTGLDEHLAEHTKFVRNRRLALYTFRYYLETGDHVLYQAAYRLEDDGRTRICVPHRMSDFSRRILAAQDLEQNNRQRMENAACLFELLKDSKVCKPVYAKLSDITTGPLYFPIYTPDRKRFNKEVCTPNEISAPGLWGVDRPAQTEDSDVAFVFRHISCLPCSQNYTPDDMKRMADLINGWDA